MNETDPSGLINLGRRQFPWEGTIINPIDRGGLTDLGVGEFPTEGGVWPFPFPPPDMPLDKWRQRMDEILKSELYEKIEKLQNQIAEVERDIDYFRELQRCQDRDFSKGWLEKKLEKLEALRERYNLDIMIINGELKKSGLIFQGGTKLPLLPKAREGEK